MGDGNLGLGEGYSCKIYRREAPVGGWRGLKFGNVGDGPSLAVARRLVSECSVPESGKFDINREFGWGWVLPFCGSSARFHLGWRRSPGRAGRWGDGGVVSRGPFVRSVWYFAG